MDTSPTLLPLDAISPALIDALLDRAFEPGRRARTAYRLREGMEWLPALSFAALDSGERLVGSIQCWPVALIDESGRAHPLIMVGPVAVLPEVQGQGFGKALMAAMLGGLSPDAPLPLVMIGDPEYYGQWGFSAALTAGWRLPSPWEPQRLLARSANPAVLPAAGVLGPWRAPAHLAGAANGDPRPPAAPPPE